MLPRILLISSRNKFECTAIISNSSVLHDRSGRPAERAPAVVLCKTVTGIATVRALARSGVTVHACVLRRDDPVRYSRYAVKVPCYDLADEELALVQFLIDYARQLGQRPVLFPSGDAHALLLAKYAEELSPYYLLWNLPYRELAQIVNKDGLYTAARAAGVPTIPGIAAPTFEALAQWSQHNAGPYLLKPNYAGDGSCILRDKNRVIGGREELLNYARAYGTQSLVIQRVLRGGDGNIFDCYGLCDRDGRVVSLTSHRRLRQHPPDFGATSYGEIPSMLPEQDEQFIFTATERLLKRVRYHGIFGIEWLRESATGRFYLIDFNARPFLTIGHLDDCGVNLPLLAYRDLCGESLADVAPRPVVQHKRWVYLSKDMDSFRTPGGSDRIGVARRLATLAGCRSFAYCSWHDPVPGIHSILQIVERAFRFLMRHLRREPEPPAAVSVTTSQR